MPRTSHAAAHLRLGTRGGASGDQVPSDTNVRLPRLFGRSRAPGCMPRCKGLSFAAARAARVRRTEPRARPRAGEKLRHGHRRRGHRDPRGPTSADGPTRLRGTAQETPRGRRRRRGRHLCLSCVGFTRAAVVAVARTALAPTHPHLPCLRRPDGPRPHGKDRLL